MAVAISKATYLKIAKIRGLLFRPLYGQIGKKTQQHESPVNISAVLNLCAQFWRISLAVKTY